MKENMKKVYSAPKVRVEEVVVENGFAVSQYATELVTNGGDLVSF